MLYELIAIVRPGSLTETKEIARFAGLTLLRAGGIIRGITNWGPFLLPKPVSVHQARQTRGHYFIMRFDAGVEAQRAVGRGLELDPRMVRFSVVKLGGRGLGVGKRMGQGVEGLGGKVEWGSRDGGEDGDRAGRGVLAEMRRRRARGLGGEEAEVDGAEAERGVD